MMKMASVSTVTTFLLCLSVLGFKGFSDACDMYAPKHSEFAVNLEHPLGDSDKLTWKLGTSLIYRRGTNDKKKEVYNNGSIKLTNVKESDQGEYSYEIFDVNGKVQGKKTIRLCVMDRLKKPVLKRECSGQNIKLTCITSEKLVEWFQDGKKLKETSLTLSKPSKDVKITKLQCQVSNNISLERSDAVDSSCPGTGAFFPDKVLGLSIWIFVGGGGGIVVVLIILVIFCCIRAKRKKHLRLRDEEEFRLGWATTGQQQHPSAQRPAHPSHPQSGHCSHQQQPAGHTGPRQNRSRLQRPKAPDPQSAGEQPRPSPRRAAHAQRPAENCEDEKPPPLPQPRKKAQPVQKV
ncbi:T-cell surface antigen CD2-like isoform 2-T2 [Menidia menidia]